MAKDITLKQAFEYLQLADGVLLENRLLEPFLIGLEDDPSHEFFYLFWSEEIHGDMIDFEVVFREGDNEKVKLNECCITFVNSEGEEEELVLLKAWQME